MKFLSNNIERKDSSNIKNVQHRWEISHLPLWKHKRWKFSLNIHKNSNYNSKLYRNSSRKTERRFEHRDRKKSSNYKRREKTKQKISFQKTRISTAFISKKSSL